jgi:hypothetical protein
VSRCAAPSPHAYVLRVDLFSPPSSLTLPIVDAAAFQLERVAAHGVAWRDAHARRLLFTVRADAPQQRDLLLRCVAQCLFEHATRRPHADATQAELDALIVADRSASARPSAPAPPLARHAGAISLPGSPLLGAAAAAGDQVCLCVADLYRYDDALSAYFLVATARVSLRRLAKFAHLLVLRDADSDGLLWAQALADGMHHHCDSVLRAFTWLWAGAELATLSLRFDRHDDDGATFAAFREAFTRSLWETKQQKAFTSVDEDQRQWILDADRDVVDDMQADDGLTDEDVSEFDGSGDDDDDGGDRSLAATRGNRGGDSDEQNSLLAVGQAHNRSFVVRGSQVGVFKQTNDDDLEYVETFTPIKNARGAPLTPSHAMLHARDTSLLLTDESDASRLYRLDLERGDVVETWQSSSNVRDLLPEKKGAQATDSPVLLGINSKAFFALDARQPNDKCVQSRVFQYAGRSPQLSCAATTGAGQLVLGTENGDVRFFSAKRSLLSAVDAEDRKPRASTALPGLGDAVTAIDVTDDGHWVLATCKTYLMCICTVDGASTGFESRMGKRKPEPRRLQLKPADVRRVGGSVSFTPARFNTGAMGEQSIVTSTGRFIVTFNFRKVRQNVLDVYQLKEFADDVVQDHFARNTDKKVVVALPNDVLLASKSVASSPKKKPT